MDAVKLPLVHHAASGKTTNDSTSDRAGRISERVARAGAQHGSTDSAADSACRCSDKSAGVGCCEPTETFVLRKSAC